MPIINGVNVPENIYKNGNFNLGFSIGKIGINKGLSYNPITTNEMVDVCGVKISKILFDDISFRMGIIAGCSTTTGTGQICTTGQGQICTQVQVEKQVSFNEFSNVKYFYDPSTDDDRSNDNLKNDYCVEEPVNFESKRKRVPKSKTKTVPKISVFEHLVLANPSFPFAQFEPTESNPTPDNPSAISDIENGTLSPNHVLVLVDFEKNKCFRTDTDEFKIICKFFHINSIQTIHFKGKQKTLNRVYPLNSDGSLNSGCTLSITQCKST